MSIIDSLEKRRSYYQINEDLPVSEADIIKTVERTTELVPDAFNMKSARIVIALGSQNKKLWDVIYATFGGKVAREKINAFAAGAGTLLYFIDEDVVAEKQAQFSRYAENFPIWANQANGMLQISIWTALRDMQVGANIQHYNPVIDDAVKAFLDLPASWRLIAQMPFGGIAAEPGAKEAEDISLRVRVSR